MLPWMQNGNNSNGQAMNVTAKPPLTKDQLDKMAIAGLSFSPSSDAGSPNVQLRLSAEQPMILTGSADDGDMRSVLTYVVENGERFDAGVRLDCLEALKAASRNQQVRQALIAAARKDQNPAVRMKALESLRESAGDDNVRQALLDALEYDANPGVRVEAVNVLVGSLQHGDTEETEPVVAGATPSVKSDSAVVDQGVNRVIHVLEQLQRRDPSRYVRLRSAAALRQIGPREVQ
jgi:HEAT repeat protein